MSRIGRIVSAACVGLVLATIAGNAAIAKPQHGRRSGQVIRTWNEIARAQAFGNPPPLAHPGDHARRPARRRQRGRPAVRAVRVDALGSERGRRSRRRRAAHRVLVAFFPANQAALDAQLAASLASVPDGPAEGAGVALGRAVGQRLLDLRADDGFDVPDPFAPTPGPGVWEPTPPAFAPMVEPQFQNVRPFTLRDRAQFLPDPPPALTSAGTPGTSTRSSASVRTRARRGPPTRPTSPTSGPRLHPSAGAASGTSSPRGRATTCTGPPGCSRC